MLLSPEWRYRLADFQVQERSNEYTSEPRRAVTDGEMGQAPEGHIGREARKPKYGRGKSHFARPCHWDRVWGQEAALGELPAERDTKRGPSSWRGTDSVQG